MTSGAQEGAQLQYAAWHLRSKVQSYQAARSGWPGSFPGSPGAVKEREQQGRSVAKGTGDIQKQQKLPRSRNTSARRRFAWRRVAVCCLWPTACMGKERSK
ncbi:hypothetical protein [Paenibacillus sp. SYP-B4298]|uniref:hypothetical protein n=1 Tax=Paenibacillus sp. SYP-B4298 TaxID=2996034 RepID=UPI0022DD74A2|nr:hypothetical protein [Paenibacillus sp. SYP-B4298]